MTPKDAEIADLKRRVEALERKREPRAKKNLVYRRCDRCHTHTDQEPSIFPWEDCYTCKSCGSVID